MYLGRVDHQVKLRGNRIELGEIEHIILKEENIVNALVVIRGILENEEQLVAFFEGEKEIDKQKLRNRLKEKLPSYMIPSYLVQLDKLPLTANGKIDRKKLNDFNIKSGVQHIISRTHNFLEKGVLKIVSDILNTQNIDINDNFFDLGGNSLNILQLCSAINKKFGIQLQIAQILKAETILEIAAMISGNKKVSDDIVILLNKKMKKNIFFLPPSLGFGLVYKNLSSYLENYSVYSFDFIESDDILNQYMDQILKIQPEGPFKFAGYSSGGNIAFELACHFEENGFLVSDLILLDSFRRGGVSLIKPNISEEEINELDKDIQIFGLSDYREKIIDKAIKSYAYYSQMHNSRPVNANIHLIISQNRYELEKPYILKNNGNIQNTTSWDTACKSEVKTYFGSGIHQEFLHKQNIQKNAVIFNSILNNLV